MEEVRAKGGVEAVAVTSPKSASYAEIEEIYGMENEFVGYGMEETSSSKKERGVEGAMGSERTEGNEEDR